MAGRRGRGLRNSHKPQGAAAQAHWVSGIEILTVTPTSGLVYLIVVGLGACFIVRAGSSRALPPADLWICRLLAVFVLFFFAFDVLGAVGMLFPGRWVTFPDAALVAIALSTAAYPFSRRRLPQTNDSATAPAAPVPQRNLTTRLVAIAVAGGFIMVAAALVIGFPRGFEANAYHLPNAVNFFRDGSLRVWDRVWMDTLPANASLWDGFWLRLLPERAVSLVNLPFLGLCVLLLYQLCRISGADRSAAGLMSCGITTIPLFGFCSTEAAADVGGVAFALAAIWLALSQPPSFPSWSVLAGAASGLAYGYKPVHLVTAALVGLLILCGRSASTRPPPSPRDRLLRTASFAASFLALAGVWLLRN